MAADANEFLKYASEPSNDLGLLRCLVVGCISDACDDALAFLRYYDDPESDPCRMSLEIEKFVGRLKYLWVQGNCWTRGYSKRML